MWEGQSVTCFSHGEGLAVKKKSAKWKCRHHVVVRVDSGTSFIRGGAAYRHVTIHRPI